MSGISRVIALIFLYVFSNASLAAERLQVVTSIKPLQLLAIAVAGDQANVDVLLDPAGSPHDYQLRPSDRVRLDRANIVFWVGPKLEHFLQPALKSASNRTTVITLDDGAVDPHIWMDPIAMQAAAQHMANALATMRPAEAQSYRTNAERISAELARIDQLLRTRFVNLAPLRGFIVEHDAYQRLEGRYGLTHLAAITDSSELPPSVSSMIKIRGLLENGKAGCVLAEPQESTQLRTLVGSYSSVRVVRLDPMAMKVQPSSLGLLEFYRQLGESIAKCLAK